MRQLPSWISKLGMRPVRSCKEHMCQGRGSCRSRPNSCLRQQQRGSKITMTTEQLLKAPSAVQRFYCILCLNNEKTYPAHLLLALVFSHPPADRQRRSGSKRTFQCGGEEWPLSPSTLFPQAAMLHWVRKSKQVFIILSSLILLHCCETLRLPLTKSIYWLLYHLTLFGWVSKFSLEQLVWCHVLDVWPKRF